MEFVELLKNRKKICGGSLLPFIIKDIISEKSNKNLWWFRKVLYILKTLFWFFAIKICGGVSHLVNNLPILVFT